MNKVFLDSKIVSENEALVPVSDRGLLMGDGVFVTIQVMNGSPLFLKRHLKKLEDQAKKFKMAPITIDEETIFQLIEENNAFTGVWRLKIYYTGGHDTSMRLPDGRKGHLIMILKPYVVPPYAPLKVSLFEKPITTLTSNLKSLSHIARYMIMEEALYHGYDDYITQDENHNLLETSFGNIFWIKNKELFTPSPELPLHFGISISVLIESYKTHFVKTTTIPEDTCLFRINTMGGIRPVIALDERIFPRDQDLEKALLNHYRQSQEVESRVSN